MALTKTPIELSSTPGIVDNSNATAITIDDSENVLVGKTATAFGTAGIALRGTVADFIRDGGTPINVNRLTDNGSLIDLHINSALVGSIGSYSGDLTIGNGSTVGLIFEQTGSDRISPWNLTTNATRDGEIDLGDSDQRWKDLYLSGGAFLGGTAAANKLEDYEEGTFTPSYGGSGADPTATYLSQTLGRYTKIGDLVHCQVEIRTSAISGGSGDLEIKGFPFTANSSSALAQGAVTLYNITFNTSYLYTFEMQASTTYGFIRGSNSGTTSQNLPVSGVINTSPALIRLTVSYKVA